MTERLFYHIVLYKCQEDQAMDGLPGRLTVLYLPWMVFFL